MSAARSQPRGPHFIYAIFFSIVLSKGLAEGVRGGVRVYRTAREHSKLLMIEPTVLPAAAESQEANDSGIAVGRRLAICLFLHILAVSVVSQVYPKVWMYM